MPEHQDWDFFVSHASEDKEEIAGPLAAWLSLLGFRVWYDEFSLKLGDSLNQSINKGLGSSAFGIVILSPKFFEKNWPRRELDGLVAMEMSGGRTKILPIWHKVTSSDIATFSPTLADKKGISSDEGIENIVKSVIRAADGIIEMPANLPTPAYDLLLPNDIPKAMTKITEFADRIMTFEEILDVFTVLVAVNIKTVSRLNELVSSNKIISTIRGVLKEELLRSDDELLKPLEVALFGGHLLEYGITKQTVLFIRDEIRHTDEYRAKHPDANIPPRKTIQLHRIKTGDELLSVTTGTYACIFRNDEPQTEEEMVLIKQFVSLVEDYADISSGLSASDRIDTAFWFDSEIKELAESGFFVYGTHLSRKVQFTNAEHLWPIAYVTITKVDTSTIIIVDDPDKPLKLW